MDTAVMEKAMKAYKPRRPKTTLADIITPEERSRRARDIQDVKDEKDRQAIKDMGYANGGKVGSASKRADGCAQRGKTRGMMV
jgi:hypothetical protein